MPDRQDPSSPCQAPPGYWDAEDESTGEPSTPRPADGSNENSPGDREVKIDPNGRPGPTDRSPPARPA